MNESVRRELHGMLTFAKLGLLHCDRDGRLHIGAAPSTVLEQLAVSVLHCQNWIHWTKTKTTLTARPSVLGDIVLDLWNDYPAGVSITEVDERELLRLQYDVTLGDELFGPPATSARPLSGLTTDELDAEPQRLTGEAFITRKDHP